MGFLDQNTTSLSNIEFPVVEGYCGSVGAAMANAEGQLEDFDLFREALNYDFKEIAALREGVDLETLQEASISGIVQRIIDFFTKLGAKIKAMFTSFMAKIDSYMVKDTKKFVEKYEKSLAGRSFKGMKAKYAAPKSGYVWPYEYAFSISIGDVGNKYEDGFKKEEYVESQFGSMVGEGSCSAKELKDKVHESLYGKEEEIDNWDLTKLNNIGSRLKAGNTVLADLKKTNDSLQNAIKKAISDISKGKTKAADGYKVDGSSNVGGIDNSFSSGAKNDKGEYSYATKKNRANAKLSSDAASILQRKYGYLQQQANAEQSVIMTFCSTKFNEAKWGIAQDRRIFAQGVAYRAVRGDVKEEAMLAEAVGEVAQHECEAEFENMEIYA